MLALIERTPEKKKRHAAAPAKLAMPIYCTDAVPIELALAYIRIHSYTHTHPLAASHCDIDASPAPADDTSEEMRDGGPAAEADDEDYR
jgi:hypothetical protein